ncbi:hypothetical protein D1872_308710 [compost metagenome]
MFDQFGRSSAADDDLRSVFFRFDGVFHAFGQVAHVQLDGQLGELGNAILYDRNHRFVRSDNVNSCTHSDPAF